MRRRVKPGKKITVYMTINDKVYTEDQLPHIASIPGHYFKRASGFRELNSWLKENSSGVSYIDFTNNIVRFENESDAVLFKLVLG
jgi:hypothetical protein